jgi:hypothetical protein
MPTLIHLYQINGSLADSNGGPSLVSLGGSTTSNGYIFGRNQGLSLTGALSSTSSYSIIIDITFNTLGPLAWQKIIDFKNRTSDDGLYVYKSGSNHGLQFYPKSGIVGTVSAGQRCRFIITRASDGATTTYVDNSEQFVFIDSTNMAVPNANFLLFCVDDLVVPNENDTGTIHRIEIYDGPLTSEILPTLPPTPTPTKTPTPTPTKTPTPTPTKTPTPTPTKTPTPTPTKTLTPTPTPTSTIEPDCDSPCFNINLTKISVDTWQGTYNDIVITFLFDENNLVISNEDGIEFWNKTISNWKNYIVDGILTLPYCQNIKIGGFCDSYLRKCIEISDQGFTLGGQNGSKRRYSWNNSDGFYYDNNTSVVNSPWTISGNVLRIDFEDDGNCKKYNSFVQTSSCRFFYNLNEETEITISWTGKGEVQDPCYDIMNIRVNGSLVAFAHAPGGGGGCDGVGDVISFPNSPYTTTLNSGLNIIEISVTTKDPLYHSGAYYEFTVTPFSCCDCNLKILNVTEKETLEDGSKVYELSVEKNDGNCCNIEYKLSNGEWTNIPSENLDCSQLVSDGKILVTMLQNWIDCNATPLPTATPTPTPTLTPTPTYCFIGCNLDTWNFSSNGGGGGGKIQGLTSGAVRYNQGYTPSGSLNCYWLLSGSIDTPRGVTFQNGGLGGTLYPGNSVPFILGEEVLIYDWPEGDANVLVNGSYYISAIPEVGGIYDFYDFYDLILCCLTPTPTPTPI